MADSGVGAPSVALPTAGNAGGAAAAYAAKAQMGCVIAMPADTPTANIIESRAFGADVRLIDGLISDCGKFIAEHAARAVSNVSVGLGPTPPWSEVRVSKLTGKPEPLSASIRIPSTGSTKVASAVLMVGMPRA